MPRHPCRAGAIAVLISASAFASGMAAAQPNRLSTHERDIVTAVTSFWQGWERGDRAQVERTLAETYVDVDADGVRRGKAEVLRFVQPVPAEQAVSITTRGHTILFLGNGSAHVSYQVADCRGPAARRGCYRFVASDTFVRERGAWRLAAGHQITQPAAAADQEGIARTDVAAAQRAIADAQIASDPEAFTRLHTEDWRLTHGRGQIVDRSGFANDMRNFWKPKAIDYAEQSIRLGRDSAIVEGVVTFRWRDATGQGREAVERHVDVFVRQYGRWRRSASSLSCIRGDCP